MAYREQSRPLGLSGFGRITTGEDRAALATASPRRRLRALTALRQNTLPWRMETGRRCPALPQRALSIRARRTGELGGSRMWTSRTSSASSFGGRRAPSAKTRPLAFRLPSNRPPTPALVGRTPSRRRRRPSPSAGRRRRHLRTHRGLGVRRTTTRLLTRAMRLALRRRSRLSSCRAQRSTQPAGPGSTVPGARLRAWRRGTMSPSSFSRRRPERRPQTRPIR